MLTGIHKTLLPVLNQVFETGVVPEEWKVSGIIPIFKKEMLQCVEAIKALHSRHLLSSRTMGYCSIIFSHMSNLYCSPIIVS